ncbi:MAG: hypothetical protein WA007_03120 [Hydrogenophaga sp.]
MSHDPRLNGDHIHERNRIAMWIDLPFLGQEVLVLNDQEIFERQEGWGPRANLDRLSA